MEIVTVVSTNPSDAQSFALDVGRLEYRVLHSPMQASAAATVYHRLTRELSRLLEERDIWTQSSATRHILSTTCTFNLK